MCASAQTCASVGEYLGATEDDGTGNAPPGQAILMRKLEHYFFWKASLGKIQLSVRNASKPRGSGAAITNQGQSRSGSSSAASDSNESAAVKRKAEWNKGGRGAPSGKRRRVRGGGAVVVEERTFKGPPGADPAKLEEEATSLAEA